MKFLIVAELSTGKCWQEAMHHLPGDCLFNLAHRGVLDTPNYNSHEALQWYFQTEGLLVGLACRPKLNQDRPEQETVDQAWKSNYLTNYGEYVYSK